MADHHGAGARSSFLASPTPAAFGVPADHSARSRRDSVVPFGPFQCSGGGARIRQLSASPTADESSETSDSFPDPFNNKQAPARHARTTTSKHPAASTTTTTTTTEKEEHDPLVDFSTKCEQLWLDLRDTAFFPHEALRFLQDQCCNRDDNNHQPAFLQEAGGAALLHLIDGVLVSQDMFEKIALQESQIIGKQSFVLFYETDDTKELIANSASAQMSIPVGKIAEDIDPMLALDVVVDQKKWLLLDPKYTYKSDTEDDSAATTKAQVSSLLQFVSASSMTLSPGERFTSSSGLIVPGLTGASDDDSPESSTTTRGGIAIVCPDQSAFLNMDLSVAEFRSSVRPTTTTESGLLVPSDESNSLDDTGHTIDDETFLLPSTALILPLDLRMWQTAMVLRQMEDDAGDGSMDLLQP